MLAELPRREKAANIMPDPDIDIIMKVRKKLLSLTYSQPQIGLVFFKCLRKASICRSLGVGEQHMAESNW